MNFRIFQNKNFVLSKNFENRNFPAFCTKYQKPVPIAAEPSFESKNLRKIFNSNFLRRLIGFLRVQKLFFNTKSKFKNNLDIARLSLNLAFYESGKNSIFKKLKARRKKTTMLKEEFECYNFESFKL